MGKRSRRAEAGPGGAPPRALLLVTALAALVLAPAAAQADFWSERFEVHGFFTSKLYGRSPGFDFGDELKVSSWRTELNLEAEFDVYSGPELRAALYGVFRPIYDGVYEIHPKTWGSRTDGGAFGTGQFPFSQEASLGERFPGRGACVIGELCLTNGDTGSLFSDELAPTMTIDDVVFFGAVTAPVVPQGSEQEHIGGDPAGGDYVDFLRSDLRRAFAVASLTETLTPVVGGAAPLLADQFERLGAEALRASLFDKASRPLGTPLNFYSGAIGSRSSLNEQAPFDVNRREPRLAFECGDNAHPWCFVREAYAELELGSTFVRVGKQQIVWGRTDAFRLQDNIMPIDLGYHNIFPDLEERRIPQLALRVIHTFGDVGPLQDLALEFAWVFDRFRPNQLGQCGEPYAFTFACQGRADAAAHQILNFGLARVEEVPWTFENTEPGLRLDFRLNQPSVALSLSAFWSHQDTPVARFVNQHSAQNPNTAAMLFLQGLGAGPLIEQLAGRSLRSTPWTQGFDPYDRSPGSELFEANEVLLQAWRRAFTVLTPTSATPGCAGVTGRALGTCADPFLQLALPWTAAEYQLEYPRVLTLGASADYQIPRSDTILRIEMAYDVDRAINDTSAPDGVDSSDMILASIGLDRPTFIRLLNPNRTAFLTFQTFVEHVIDYDDEGFGDGMVIPETQVISTFLMQNFWRQDSLILTSFVAYDWNARAWAAGPSFRWVMSQNIFVDFGVNMLFGGEDHVHNIRDVCDDGSLDCLGEPTTWNEGQWQTLNREAIRFARAPWWNRQSFADDFMEDRDEVWVGFTYQF